jgi:hypothetical protein
MFLSFLQRSLIPLFFSQTFTGTVSPPAPAPLPATESSPGPPAESAPARKPAPPPRAIPSAKQFPARSSRTPPRSAFHFPSHSDVSPHSDLTPNLKLHSPQVILRKFPLLNPNAQTNLHLILSAHLNLHLNWLLNLPLQQHLNWRLPWNFQGNQLVNCTSPGPEFRFPRSGS